MWQVIHHLNDAVVTGTARKAAKREPTSSPGGIGSVASGSGSAATGACQLQALTNRRGCARAVFRLLMAWLAGGQVHFARI